MIAITSKESFKKVASLPTKVTIGDDFEAYFRPVMMDEFDGIQDKMNAVDALQESLSEEDRKNPDKVREHSKKVSLASRETIADLMIDLLTDEVGALVFKQEDKADLLSMITPKFTRQFIDAFMQSQGVKKEDISKAEEQFRK